MLPAMNFFTHTSTQRRYTKLATVLVTAHKERSCFSDQHYLFADNRAIGEVVHARVEAVFSEDVVLGNERCHL